MASKNSDKKVAVSFDEMIQADRKKRKAEQLAQQIFGKNRKAATPAVGSRKNSQSPAGGSLASRVGVTKTPSQPRASGLANERRQTHGNTNVNNTTNRPQANRGQRRPFRDAAAHAGPRGGAGQAVPAHFPAVAQAPSATAKLNDGMFSGSEINIRGAAGPYCVVASNFAPGTTAADIESVMTPIGGEMLGCKLISSNPTVIVEMVFVERSGADNVIAMFNNKKADGRLLYVYMKEGGPSQPLSTTQNPQRTSSPAHTRPIQPMAQALPVPSPHPAQDHSEDVMEVDPDSMAANETSFAPDANVSPEAGNLNGNARPHSRGDDSYTRAPREPREPYRPPPRDGRPAYRDDYPRGPRQANPDVQDGRYGFQDQDYPRQGGGYGGGGGAAYRDDRRGGRFRDNGRMYSDSMMGRGGGGRFRR